MMQTQINRLLSFGEVGFHSDIAQCAFHPTSPKLFNLCGKMYAETIFILDYAAKKGIQVK